jgi:hypothetical protein
MFARFAEACRLLKENFWLFAAIVLTVMLPANIFLNLFMDTGGSTNELVHTMRLMFIEMAFSLISTGALYHSLLQIKSGRSVTYKEAMTVGFKKCQTLYIANLVAGIFICLGFVALIIPGFFLMVRYSFIDAVVVIEDKGTKASLARSTELTTGYKWQIFWAFVVFVVSFLILSIAIELPVELITSLKILPIEIVLDCIRDIAASVMTIVLFLFYWESVQANKPISPTFDDCELSLFVHPINDSQVILATDNGQK